MRHLFETPTVDELKTRVMRLRPDSERLWGTMTAAQAMAHCAIAMEWAVGDTKPPRMFVGRIIGGLIKTRVLRDDAPLRQNTPTAPTLVVSDQRELQAEQERLRKLLDRFAAGGPGRCTTHPHSFFGPLTPQEWAQLMYKHVDHHLRQFGA